MTCIGADEGAGVSWRAGGAGSGAAVRPGEQAADAESLVVSGKPWWRRNCRCDQQNQKPAHLEVRPPRESSVRQSLPTRAWIERNRMCRRWSFYLIADREQLFKLFPNSQGRLLPHGGT